MRGMLSIALQGDKMRPPGIIDGTALTDHEEYSTLTKEIEEKSYLRPPVAPMGTEFVARRLPLGSLGVI
jgi:hypothetical protein